MKYQKMTTLVAIATFVGAVASGAPASAQLQPEEKAKIKRMTSELDSEVKRASDPTAFSKKKLREYWHPAFDQPWESPDASKEKSQSLKSPESKGRNVFTVHSLLRGGENDIAQQQSVGALVMLCGAPFESVPNAGTPHPLVQFPGLFTDRQDKLPVTKGDMLISLVASTGIDAFYAEGLRMPEGGREALDASLKLTDEQLQTWISFAKAKNPIYRSIALDVFKLLRPTAEQAKQFFTSYVNESEESVNLMLIEALRQRDDPWAADLLKRMEGKISNEAK